MKSVCSSCPPRSPHQTYNHIFGYTSNPFRTSLSSGGSSGGESSLLALRGSPLGIGTDIGGSIRIPASFTGVYSLKPSVGRFPTYGVKSGLPGQEAVKSVVGALAPTLAALQMWCEAILSTEPWRVDPNVLPIPWRGVTLPESLVFGVVMDDGVVRPLPPIARALHETKAALEARGHKVVVIPPFHGSSDDFRSVFSISPGATVMNDVLKTTDQPWPIGFDEFKACLDPSELSGAASSATSAVDSHPTIGGHADIPVVPTGQTRYSSIERLWKAQVARTTYAKQGLDWWIASEQWTGTGRPMDGLLQPVSPWPACPK